MEGREVARFGLAIQCLQRQSRWMSREVRELDPHEAFEVGEFALAHSAHLCQIIDGREGTMRSSIGKDARSHHRPYSRELFQLRHRCRVNAYGSLGDFAATCPAAL